ncbi:MAG: DNA primase [Rhodospirillaceae bacterium]|nr:MAG: DNA primase [Rhodospirillaceae bacterium]
MSAEALIVEYESRIYEIRGLNPFASARMRVTLRLTIGDSVHVDTLDLYSSRARKSYSNGACESIDVSVEIVLADLGKLISVCEAKRDSAIKELREGFNTTAPALSKKDEKMGMGLLANPNLIEQIESDMNQLGYIGEKCNKILAYLVAVSRKLPEPLSSITLSRSSAGKSALLGVIEQLIPPEDVIAFSSLTPQALFYMPPEALKHKVLMIEERHGSESSDYAIRELQTKRVLRKGLPIKDPLSGRMKTFMIEVEGPVAVMETTTSTDINPENSNRCFLLHIDESSEQTGRVMAQQRRAATLEGFRRKSIVPEIVETHHAAQRLLQTMRVVIPFAENIYFPTKRIRNRRDHSRFLSLIQSITCLHQFQRPQKETEINGEVVRYLEATVADYELAYDIARQVFVSSLDDLSPMARSLFELIKANTKSNRPFFRPSYYVRVNEESPRIHARRKNTVPDPASPNAELRCVGQVVNVIGVASKKRRRGVGSLFCILRFLPNTK